MPPNLPYATTITSACRNAVFGRTAHRHAVPRDDLLPGEIERLLRQQFGQVRQPVADLHQRQAASEVRDGDAEHRRALELPQGLDLFLGIVGGAVRHAIAQLDGQFGTRRRRVEQPLVEQFVEQQRKRRDLVRQELRMRAELEQPFARHRVLVEQREVNGAAADAFDHVQHASQRSLGIRGAGYGPQEARKQNLQSAATGFVEPAVIGTFAQRVELAQERLDQVRRVQRREPLTPARVVELGIEDALEAGAGLVVRGCCTGREHRALEVCADATPVVRELALEFRPARQPHGEGKSRAGMLVDRAVRGSARRSIPVADFRHAAGSDRPQAVP